MAEKEKKAREKHKSKAAARKAMESLMRGYNVDTVKLEDVPRLSTGSPSLDNYLSGGIPRGAISQVYGPPRYGKTTLTGMIIANNIDTALEEDKQIIYFDMEGKVDASWMRRIGVPISINENTGDYESDILLSDGLPVVVFKRAQTAEQVMSAIIDAIGMCEDDDSAPYLLFVIDSLAKMIPQAALEASFDKGAQMALHAKLMTLFTNKAGTSLPKGKLAIIGINQVRADIGGYSMYKTTGGYALSHAISLDVVMHKPEIGYNGKEATSLALNIMLRPSTAAKPRKEKIEILLSKTAEGFFLINYEADMITSAKDMGIFRDESGEAWKGGNSVAYLLMPCGELRKVGSGQPRQEETLREDQEMATELMRQIKERL